MGALGSPLPPAPAALSSQSPGLCGQSASSQCPPSTPLLWGRGDLDCMAPFPGIISHLAVTLNNKMGHNFPGTQTLSAAGAAPRGGDRRGGPARCQGHLIQTHSLHPACAGTPAPPLPPRLAPCWGTELSQTSPTTTSQPWTSGERGTPPDEADTQGSWGGARQASWRRGASRDPMPRQMPKQTLICRLTHIVAPNPKHPEGRPVSTSSPCPQGPPWHLQDTLPTAGPLHSPSPSPLLALTWRIPEDRTRCHP